MKWFYRMFSVIFVALAGIVGVHAQDTNTIAVPEYTSAVEADGDALIIYGRVLDQNGDPLAGVRIDLWQTDSYGGYDHPNANNAGYDENFQHYGSTVSDADGVYSFRTVYPSNEGVGRPLHIHFKVWVDGEQVLTSQFYFVEDSANSRAESVLLDPQAATDGAGNPELVAYKDIVLATADSANGSLAATPGDIEGPYYPVVDVSEYDNDLVVVSPQDVTTADPAAQTAAEFTLLNLNTTSGDTFLTIPNMSSRMVREFQEYRPYVSIQQFRREIGKYVSADVVVDYEQYIYVPVNVDNSDAETLKQIPGVDDTIASALITARPFGSNDAFLSALGQYLAPADVAYAANYLGA